MIPTKDKGGGLINPEDDNKLAWDKVKGFKVFIQVLWDNTAPF